MAKKPVKSTKKSANKSAKKVAKARAVPAPLAGPRPPPLTSQEIVALLRRRAQGWVRLPNVTSVGVGYEQKNGKSTGRLSIQVTVREKLTAVEMKARGVKPLPTSVRADNGQLVPVDVIAREYRLSYALVPNLPGTPFVVTAFANPRLTRISRLTRVMPGVSVSHRAGLAGTLGAIVYDNVTGAPCALSNAHVLAIPGGSPSPTPTAECDADVVVQPGRSDDADVARNRLGRVLRSHVGLAGDCAVAVVDARIFDERILELNVTPRRVAKADLGDAVVKSGRKTGVTRGLVTRIGIVVPIDYPAPIGQRDVGAFEIGPDPAAPPPDDVVATGGDSGSVWLAYDNGAPTDIAVGLHFASQLNSESFVEHALACNMHSVLEKLDVSLGPKA